MLDQWGMSNVLAESGLGGRRLARSSAWFVQQFLELLLFQDEINVRPVKVEGESLGPGFWPRPAAKSVLI
jgi:hypothetical protein